MVGDRLLECIILKNSREYQGIPSLMIEDPSIIKLGG